MMIFWYLLMSVSSCCWGPPVWFWEEPLSLFSYYSSSLVVLVQVLTSCGRWDLPGGEKKKKKRRKTQFSVTQIQEADILAFHVTSPAQDTFAFLGLGLAERGSRSLRRLRRRWLCCGGRRDLCYHGVNSSRHVGGSQGSVGSSSSPQRVVGAELAPLCAQNHHHLRHGDLWVLGSDEGPETGVRK